MKKVLRRSLMVLLALFFIGSSAIKGIRAEEPETNYYEIDGVRYEYTTFSSFIADVSDKKPSEVSVVGVNTSLNEQVPNSILSDVSITFVNCEFGKSSFMLTSKQNVELHFEGCKFTGNFLFQSSAVGDHSLANHTDFYYKNCEFTSDKFYDGDGIGDLVFENCTNIGRINATNNMVYNPVSAYINSKGEPSKFVIKDCTFASSCTAYATPDQTKNGATVLAWGKSFATYSFSGNKWADDDSNVWIKAYSCDWNGRNSSSYDNCDKIIEQEKRMEFTNAQQDGRTGCAIIAVPARMHTLTVNYINENGEAVAERYIAELEEETEYMVTSPEVEGMQADIEVVEGTLMEDTVIDVIYTAIPKMYTLTINYVNEDGEKVADLYVAELEEGTTYSVKSPEVEGMQADTEVVEGTLMEDTVVDVIYAAIPKMYTLTINYVNEDGEIVADLYVAELEEGTTYSVKSPEVEGMQADTEVVEGTLMEDAVFTVVYKTVAAETEPPVPSTGDYRFMEMFMTSAVSLVGLVVAIEKKKEILR